MTSNVVELRRAPRDERTEMNTIVLDLETANSWKLPPFQRPLRVNDKVRQIAQQIKDTESVSGVITLGEIERGPEKGTYLMDGQHRVEAFRISEMKEALADVRTCKYDNLADMGQAFVELNSQIVKMRPDDVLRGMEGHIPAIATVRRLCPFVGYDMIRRSATSPILSMSLVIKSWTISTKETPASGALGGGVMTVAQDTPVESLKG